MPNVAAIASPRAPRAIRMRRGRMPMPRTRRGRPPVPAPRVMTRLCMGPPVRMPSTRLQQFVTKAAANEPCGASPNLRLRIPPLAPARRHPRDTMPVTACGLAVLIGGSGRLGLDVAARPVLEHRQLAVAGLPRLDLLAAELRIPGRPVGPPGPRMLGRAGEPLLRVLRQLV